MQVRHTNTIDTPHKPGKRIALADLNTQSQLRQTAKAIHIQTQTSRSPRQSPSDGETCPTSSSSPSSS